jgi:exoribonuclease R
LNQAGTFPYRSGVRLYAKKETDLTQRKSLKRKQEDFSSAQILGLMEEKKHSFLLKEVLFELGLKKDRRREVKERLEGFVHEGKMVKVRRNRYALPSKMNLVVGKVKCHPDGYGFVIPEKEGEADVFINAQNLREAMHGDRVVASVESVRRKGRKGRSRILEKEPEGSWKVHQETRQVRPPEMKVLSRSVPMGTKRNKQNRSW